MHFYLTQIFSRDISELYTSESSLHMPQNYWIRVNQQQKLSRNILEKSKVASIGEDLGAGEPLGWALQGRVWPHHTTLNFVRFRCTPFILEVTIHAGKGTQSH